jgi:hypothetical protein
MNKTSKAIRKLMCATGYLLNNYDMVSGTPLYKQSLKQKGNAFLAELMKLETSLLETKDSPGTIHPPIAYMFEKFYSLFDRMIVIGFDINDKSEEEQRIINQKLDQIMRTHDLKGSLIEKS